MKNVHIRAHSARALAIALGMMASWSIAVNSRAWADDAPAAPVVAVTPAAPAMPVLAAPPVEPVTPVVAAPQAAPEAPLVVGPPDGPEEPVVPVSTAAPEAPFVVAAPPDGPEEPVVAVSTAAPEEKAPEQPSVIAERLTGLVFVKDQNEIDPTGIKDLSGIRVRNIPLLENAEFKRKLSAYIGKPLTGDSKAGLIEDVVVFCRERNHPLIDVSIPPQEITSGVLQVLILEGSIGQIRVEGARWFDSKSAQRQISLKPGDALDSSVIMGDLDWLNRNPFRQVDLVYEKGSQPGKTDLVLRQTDQVPFRLYAGYEDSGTELTEEGRRLAGVNWGNFFGGGGQLNYQFMASPDARFFTAHSASLVQPLPWRHILTFYGSYGDNKADMAATSPIGLTGFSWQAAMRYEVPFRGSNSYKHSLVGGFDFKRSNSQLFFGNFKAFGTEADVAQWSLGYNADLKDGWGSTSLRATVFYSHGGFTDKNTKAVFGAVRTGASPEYTYGRAELNRTTELFFDLMLVNQVTFQAADANLLASEQLGFGGYDTIRGYDTRVVNTDLGVIVSNELRTPPFSLLGKRAKDKFQLLAFADYGRGKDKKLMPGEKKSYELLGVGPGLRYTISSHLSVRADYGWQVHNVEGASRRTASRGHLGVVLSY